MTVFPFFVQSFEKLVSRAGFVQYVKHAFQIAGFEIIGHGPSIDLDERGFEFLRTLTLRHVKAGYDVRIVEPDDLIEANGGHPKTEQIIAMYARPVSYEHDGYRYFLRRACVTAEMHFGNTGPLS